MAKLILVRHGETDWNKQNRVQGTLDIPLNNTGKEEAQRISGELSKFKIDTICSRSASCGFSTACEIAIPHKLKVRKMDEFNELNHGVWQGLLLKHVKKRYKKQYNMWKASPSSCRPPKGESIRDASDRAVSAIRKIIDKHEGKNICIVSHDMILSIIKCYFKNAALEKMREFVSGKASWEEIEL